MPSRDNLVLVPTQWEMKHVRSTGGLEASGCRLELCGLGPVAAAARTAHLLGGMKPAHVILVGSAGTYDEERLPVGQAIAGSSVTLDGVGTGDGEWFRDVGEMGLLQWPGDADTPSIGTSLDLTAPTSAEAQLLTVCAASADPLQVQRRRDRFPEALAEEMEGFGVALACALDGISLSIVRGISNVAGERNRGEWKMEEAIKAALETVHGLLRA